MTALDDLSAEAEDLIFAALDHAIENAEISAQGFTPFALMETSTGRAATRFVSGDGSDLGECLASGRESLRLVEPDVTCVALAWDGYLTYEDQHTEAVFVEGYEIGNDTGVLLAQRYIRGSEDLTTEGDPILVDEPEPLVHARRT